MGIRWRLAAVMADKEVDNKKLSELTGLHIGTISKLRKRPPRRVDWNTLRLLCDALDVEPGELIQRLTSSTVLKDGDSQSVHVKQTPGG